MIFHSGILLQGSKIGSFSVFSLSPKFACLVSTFGSTIQLHHSRDSNSIDKPVMLDMSGHCTIFVSSAGIACFSANK